MIKKTNMDSIQSYLEDASGLLGGYADSVAIAENEKEIIEILRESSDKKIPVTVSGGGTGVTGGRIPFGGTLLSLESLNSIIDVRKSSQNEATAIIQPGVTVADLKKAVLNEGFMYPPDPTEQTAFVGGNIATNASGSRGYKFGSTRKYVRALTVILSDGSKIKIKRGNTFADNNKLVLPLEQKTISFELPDYTLPRIKNAAGYFSAPGMDIIDLFIGQEGTLGVVTEIEVALLPKIDKMLSGIAFFPNEERSWDFVQELKKFRRDSSQLPDPLIPDVLSIEYFDGNALALLKGDYPQIPPRADAAIFFELDMSAKDENRQIDYLAQLLEKYNVSLDDVWFSTTEKEQQIFREFRHRLPEKVNEIIRKNKFPKVGTDIAVPEAFSREMLVTYKEELKKLGLPYLIFGHIGENHMHANILPATESEFNRAKALYLNLIEKAVGFGGTASAEHGIGKIKHAFLEKMVGKSGMKEMARIKQILDPACILGRNNIFPENLL